MKDEVSMTTLAFLGDWLVPVLVVLFLAVSIILILTVLIQRPQGGGLVGAFGSGAGSGQTAFGAKTGDALTLATIGIFLLYLIVAVGLNWVVSPSGAPEATPAAGVPAGAPPDESPLPATDGAGDAQDAQDEQDQSGDEEPADSADTTDSGEATGDEEPPTGGGDNAGGGAGGDGG